MFHLWIGVMTGLLLAYLWMRTQAPRQRRWWHSERWWLAGFVLAVLFIPLLWDLWRTGYGISPIDAIKTVLLPWGAGVGFGVWMSSIVIGPMLREAPDTSPPSFIPIAIAMLFVTVIVSEERYGWF